MRISKKNLLIYSLLIIISPDRAVSVFLYDHEFV